MPVSLSDECFQFSTPRHLQNRSSTNKTLGMWISNRLVISDRFNTNKYKEKDISFNLVFNSILAETLMLILKYTSDKHKFGCVIMTWDNHVNMLQKQTYLVSIFSFFRQFHHLNTCSKHNYCKTVIRYSGIYVPDFIFYIMINNYLTKIVQRQNKTLEYF